MSKLSQLFIALVLAIGVCTPAPADPATSFGPQTFELTLDESASFTESIEVEDGGEFVLYLRNGDQESSRVTAATVRVNGATVVAATDLEQEPHGLSRPVSLEAGANELVVDLEGPAGSFVTLAVGLPGHSPIFIHGRLLLPWGRDDGERKLALALKNGSPRFARLFRVVFFHPNGEVAAASERIALPPRGSRVLSAEQLIGDADWEAGSVDIFYAGRGTGRLFGSARQVSVVALGLVDIESLEHAGVRVFRHRADQPTLGHSRRR